MEKLADNNTTPRNSTLVRFLGFHLASLDGKQRKDAKTKPKNTLKRTKLHTNKQLRQQTLVSTH
jgi:hypothetical protein